MADPIDRSGSNYSAPRDANRVPTLLGVLNTDGITPTPLEVNSSGQLLTTSSGGGGGGGTQYQELATTTPATGTLNLGRYQSSLPTLTTGQMNEPMLDASSRLLVVDSAAESSLSTISTNTTGVATAANQSTGNTSLGTIATNTTGVSTAANQTTMNTNLSSIVTNTGNGATSANQTNGTQTSKLTDGTNTANVVPGDTGFNGVATSSGTKTYTFTTSTPGAQSILANTLCEGYSWVEVVYTSVGSGLAVTGMFSTVSGGTYVNSSTFGGGAGIPNGVLGASVNTVYGSGIHGNFFQINVTALTSGTFAGTVTFRVIPPPNSSISAGQNGTWTVQPGNTPNTTAWLVTGTGGTFPVTQATASNLNATVVGQATAATAPTTAFEEGTIASTSLPTAVTNGQLVGAMGDKFGRTVVIPQATRDIMGIANLTITASTSPTSLIVAAGSGIFTDITDLSIVNTSGTATEVDISDGTNIYYFYVPAGDMRGAVYQVPCPATTANTAWTATTLTSVSSVKISAKYIKNK